MPDQDPLLALIMAINTGIRFPETKGNAQIPNQRQGISPSQEVLLLKWISNIGNIKVKNVV